MPAANIFEWSSRQAKYGAETALPRHHTKGPPAKKYVWGETCDEPLFAGGGAGVGGAREGGATPNYGLQLVTAPDFCFI